MLYGEIKFLDAVLERLVTGGEQRYPNKPLLASRSGITSLGIASSAHMERWGTSIWCRDSGATSARYSPSQESYGKSVRFCGVTTSLLMIRSVAT